jgi:hypothetical protein
VLGEAADYARQGQVEALKSLGTAESETPRSAEVEDFRSLPGG